MRTLALSLAAALTLVAGTARSAAAQTRDTIVVCYANKSGSMYRVGVPGTPTTCTNANHKKEVWSKGPLAVGLIFAGPSIGSAVPVVSDLSKGITGVRRTADGRYCLTIPGGSGNGSLAFVNVISNVNGEAQFVGSGSCTFPEFGVVTRMNGVLSNDVNFQIFVP